MEIISYGELLHICWCSWIKLLQTIQLHCFHGVGDTLFTRDIVHKLMKEAEKAICQDMKCTHNIRKKLWHIIWLILYIRLCTFTQTGILSWSSYRKDQELVLWTIWWAGQAICHVIHWNNVHPQHATRPIGRLDAPHLYMYICICKAYAERLTANCMTMCCARRFCIYGK